MFEIRKVMQTVVLTAGVAILATSLDITAFANEFKTLPSAGIDFILSSEGTSIKEISDAKVNNESKTGVDIVSLKDKVASTPDAESGDELPTKVSIVPDGNDTEEVEEKVVEETVIASPDKTVKEAERDLEAWREREGFKNLVIAKVNDWVNVRADASEDAEKVGKLYDKSVGEFIEEKNGWYKISSGSCTGYVSADYCVTGDEAVELAQKVGTRVAIVDTTTLFVRAEATKDSACLGMVPLGEVLTVSEELDGWAKVNIEEGDGYVCLDYVKLSTEFVKAESKEEEEARKKKEEEARLAALAAAEKANRKNNAAKGKNGKVQYIYASGEGSAIGNEVANYALQFNGNPYVYGGTSLTNGADCSGFVLSVYKHFGVSLPHSANADRKMGYAVEGGVANAQPGDLICYSGHVGIYIGNGKIIHASTAKTGIKVSNVSYRSVLAVRRIF